MTVEPFPAPTFDTCANCVFWVDHAVPDKSGACRRFPPKAAVVEIFRSEDRTIVGNQTLSLWPNVNADMWCGEHRRR